MTDSCGYDEHQDQNEQVISRHGHALKCLADKGDVAYVSLDEAKKFFRTVRTLVAWFRRAFHISNNFRRQQPISAVKYAYLCPNGSIELIIDNEKPCVWQRQPWPIIISNK